MFEGLAARIEDLKDRHFNRVALQVWNPHAPDPANNYVVLRVKPDEVPYLIEDQGMVYLPETHKFMHTYAMFAGAHGNTKDATYSVQLATGEQRAISFPPIALN